MMLRAFVFMMGWGLMLPALAEKSSAPTSLEFSYTVSLNFDFNKRLEALKKSGESPSTMEQALSVLKGSIHAANIKDVVELTPTTYYIMSSGESATAVSLAVGSKKLDRESRGQRSTDGYVTAAYYEKRADSEPFIARFESRLKRVNFLEGKQVKGSQPYANCIDPLTVAYQFIGRDFPKGNIELHFTDGRALKNYTFARSGDWTFTVSGKEVRTTRFSKKVSKDDPAILDVYYSTESHYPIRAVLGLNDRYGATIQFDLNSFPVSR